MVTAHERSIAQYMVKQGHWKVFEAMRVANIEPIRFKPLFEMIRRRQKVDAWHHAPCCPANHWGRRRLVFSGCTCGAEKHKVT